MPYDMRAMSYHTLGVTYSTLLETKASACQTKPTVGVFVLPVKYAHIRDIVTRKACRVIRQPKTLRYSARAKIRPDPEFKSDINKIRKAERKLLGALKKFHYRSVERNKLKLRELKRKSRSRNLPSTSNNTDVKRHRAKNRDN